MPPLVPAVASPSPPELKQRADRLAYGLHPGVLAWIEREANLEVAQPRIDEFRLRQTVARRFNSQGGELSAAETDAMVFLVLKTAAGLTETLFRDTLKLIWKLNEDRQVLREALALYIETRPLLKTPPPERSHLRVVPPVADGHLEALDAEAEAASLRLQLLTEQRNRVLSTLYGLVKKAPASAARLRQLR